MQFLFWALSYKKIIINLFHSYKLCLQKNLVIGVLISLIPFNEGLFICTLSNVTQLISLKRLMHHPKINLIRKYAIRFVYIAWHRGFPAHHSPFLFVLHAISRACKTFYILLQTKFNIHDQLVYIVRITHEDLWQHYTSAQLPQHHQMTGACVPSHSWSCWVMFPLTPTRSYKTRTSRSLMCPRIFIEASSVAGPTSRSVDIAECCSITFNQKYRTYGICVSVFVFLFFLVDRECELLNTSSPGATTRGSRARWCVTMKCLRGIILKCCVLPRLIKLRIHSFN